MARSRTKRPFLILALAASISTSLHAAPGQAKTFSEARSKASSSKRPLLVFIHGSAWHPASQRFLSKLWQNPAFARKISEPVVMTDIHIKQNQTKEEQERDKKNRQGWKDKPISTYPAVQLYASDGHLLKTLLGRELIKVATPDKLARHLNPLIDAAGKRNELLRAYQSKLRSNQHEQALKLLSELLELPLDHETDIIKMLEEVDPDDQSGWQARVKFNDWYYMHDVTKQLADGQAEQVLKDAERKLEFTTFTPNQRSLLLGAKGRALASMGKFDEAWPCFEDAYQISMDSPTGKAILNYGIRVAGFASREIVDPSSPLAGKNVGKNITKNKATFTLSTQEHDDENDHRSLLSGQLASSGFAFHTANERGAHVVIDLKGECELRALRITNRGSLRERAQGLTVWISSDQRQWKKVWQAESLQDTWPILLDRPVKASYIKVGLPKNTSNHLHLQAVDAFGNRL